MNIRISSDERFYLLEWGLLAAGAAAGLALAWLLIGLDWSFPSELERARAAGIVSVTTLSGYAKSRDLVAYVMTLGLPAAGALLFWLFGRGASDLGKYTLAGRFPAPTLAVWIIAGLCPFLAGFIAWHLSYMFVPKWNPYVGAWPFLGEQGATLAWVQSIWSGGVYGRDFFCLYGPMFIYPLAWLMDGFGQNVLMDGVYKLALDIAACGLLGFMLARMLRARSLALLFVLMVCMFFPTQLMSSANTTLLRTVLAMVPIACIALWVDTRRKAYFIAGSLLLGQSLLFSQEAGFCAVLAIAVMLVEGKRDPSGAEGDSCILCDRGPVAGTDGRFSRVQRRRSGVARLCVRLSANGHARVWRIALSVSEGLAGRLFPRELAAFCCDQHLWCHSRGAVRRMV